MDYLNRKIDTAIAATNTATSDAATGKRLIATTLNTWKNGTVTNKAHPITQLVDAEDKNPPTFESINSKLEYIKSTPGVTEPYTDSDGNQLYVQADGTTTTDSTKADPNPPTGAKNPLKIAAANAGNLSAGTAAWVNGEFIIGTGSDNNKYYTHGITDGLAKVNVTYVYHQHTKACYKICTITVNYTSKNQQNLHCSGSTESGHSYDCWQGYEQHSICGNTGVVSVKHIAGRNTSCPASTTWTHDCLICGKTETTIEQAIINY